MFIYERLASSTGQVYQPPLPSMAPYRIDARSVARRSNSPRPPSACIHFRTLPMT